MKNLNMEKAIERYNGIMFDMCLEFNTIGTNFSEIHEEWNIRDLVAECDYQLGLFYEDGTMQYEDLHSEDEYTKKQAISQVGKLKRFISAYKPFIDGLKCVIGHCSQYDN